MFMLLGRKCRVCIFSANSFAFVYGTNGAFGSRDDTNQFRWDALKHERIPKAGLIAPHSRDIRP